MHVAISAIRRALSEKAMNTFGDPYPAPVVTDGLVRLGEFVVDRNFLCAVVICGYPSCAKTALATRLAEIADAVVLDTDTYASMPDRHAPSRLAEVVEIDASGAQRRTTFPLQAFSALLATGFRTAKRCPVVIDAPCLGHVHIAAQRRIRLADHLREHVGDDVAVATAWVETNDPPPPYWPASGSVIQRPAVSAGPQHRRHCHR